MLLMLALTVMGVVAAVGWTGSVRVGHVFEAIGPPIRQKR
jgi:hypothetical protein